jgi:hypothetical protein
MMKKITLLFISLVFIQSLLNAQQWDYANEICIPTNVTFNGDGFIKTNVNGDLFMAGTFEQQAKISDTVLHGDWNGYYNQPCIESYAHDWTVQEKKFGHKKSEDIILLFVILLLTGIITYMHLECGVVILNFQTLLLVHIINGNPSL